MVDNYRKNPTRSPLIFVGPRLSYFDMFTELLERYNNRPGLLEIIANDFARGHIPHLQKSIETIEYAGQSSRMVKILSETYSLEIPRSGSNFEESSLESHVMVDVSEIIKSEKEENVELFVFGLHKWKEDDVSD